jgi:succinyl-diaminopimelate desuccinylase
VNPLLAAPSGDLPALTKALIDVPSVSRQEGPLATLVEEFCRTIPGLTVERVGDNVVARTTLGRGRRLVLAGHLDTVPAEGGNDVARIADDGTVHGRGACDMKGTLAVFLDLARSTPSPSVDVSYVFYTCEEIAAPESGLGQLFVERPDLVAGDAAVLGEPSAGGVEAGCQGTLRVRLRLHGARAHTARPWMGRNAIHRLGPVLSDLARFQPRQPLINGLQFREAAQAVAVEGGVAGNVVPDSASVLINVRFAPDRTAEEAAQALFHLLEDHIEPADSWNIEDTANAAWPAIDHPLLAPLVDQLGLAVQPKLGWTDVARFAAAGIPAVNVGAGDALHAHTADEHVTRAHLEGTRAALAHLLG